MTRCIDVFLARTFFLFVFLAVANPELRALDPSTPVTRYGHDVWDSHRGLPSFAIHALHQSKDGYLWLATDEGLVRFDGVQFRLFDRSNTPAILHNDISSLVEDTAGNLWFGTRGGGLCELHAGEFRRYTTEDQLAGNVVHSMFLNSRNELWIGVESNGLSRLVSGSFTTFKPIDARNTPTVYSVFETKDRTLLIGAGGLQRKIDGASSFEIIPRQKMDFVKTILEDRSGRRWIGTNSGLYILEGDSTTLCTFPGAPTSGVVSCLNEDRDENLWVGTEGHGLYRLTNGIFTRYTVNDGLSSDRVLSLTEDRQGSLWIGTRGGGLDRLRNQNIRTISREDGLSGDYVSAVYEDSRGSMWIGVRDHGVDELAGGPVIHHYPLGSGTAANHVRSIEEDNDGDILLGTMNGVVILKRNSNGGRSPVIPHGILDGLSRYSIRSIRARKDGSVLYGTYGGGVMNASRDNLRNVLSGSNVRSLLESPDGTLWVAVKGGVFHVSGDEIRKFSPAEGLSSDEAFSLYQEDDSTLWAGTYGGGLCRIRNGKVFPITKQSGLFDDVVYTMLDDNYGNLWIGCNKGIFRVSKKDLNAFADGKLARLSCASFGLEDGMKSAECNGGSQPSGWRTRGGQLVFPTVKGVVMLDPKYFQSSKESITSIIEQIIADGDTLLCRPELTVPLGKRSLEIHFTGITFTGAEKITFRYMLEGVEKTWTEAGTRRRAYFTNIPPGRYKFRVAVASPDGRWSTTEASSILVIPPFVWETGWFEGLSALTILLLTFVSARYISTKTLKRRLREVEAQRLLENERSRISQDMHDEVGASLTQIAILSELMERHLDTPDAAAAYLKKISSTAQEVVGSLDEIVWLINPRHDSLESLVLYLREYLAGYFDATEINCRFEFPGELPPLSLSADVRRNIFLVAKEAANNIVKHAGATEVSVHVGYADRSFDMVISDNGEGTGPPDASAFGNGLRNMQKRVEEIGGTFSMKSTGGKGTTILMEVELRGQ